MYVCVCVCVCIYIYLFIHLSYSIRRLTTMSFHLSLSSAALFNSPYVFFPDHLSISCIHVSLGLPCFLIPSTCPSRICKCDTPADPLNTCPAYFISLFIISFKKCNSVCILLSTSLLVILSLKFIFSIFLQDHISSASTFCRTFLFHVQLSHP